LKADNRRYAVADWLENPAMSYTHIEEAKDQHIYQQIYDHFRPWITKCHYKQ